MPIEFNKKLRVARKRDGTMPVVKPSTEAPPPAPATKRVRMLRSVNCRLGSFREGQSVWLEQNTACSWIGFGLAEEDKSLDGAPEVK